MLVGAKVCFDLVAADRHTGMLPRQLAAAPARRRCITAAISRSPAPKPTFTLFPDGLHR